MTKKLPGSICPIRRQVSASCAVHVYDFGLVDDSGRAIGTEITCTESLGGTIAMRVQATRDGQPFGALSREMHYPPDLATQARWTKAEASYWRNVRKYGAAK